MLVKSKTGSSDIHRNPFPSDIFEKYNVKTNPKMQVSMYLEIQSDQRRITRNAFEKSNF